MTSSSDFSSWYTSTVQSGPSGPLLLMHHPHPILAFKPLILFPPTLYLLPLHPHHRLMILAVSLYLLLPLSLSIPSGLFNGMMGVSEPGALNSYTFFRLIPLTLFVSRNPKAVNRIRSQSATCYYKIPLLFILRAGLRRGLMGLQPQAHPKIGPPLYQVNEVIKVTDTITFKK